MSTALSTCFHCGAPTQGEIAHRISYEGQQFPVCCHGCAQAAETIIGSGLGSYYHHRENHYADKVATSLGDKLKHYDLPEIQKEFVTTLPNQLAETTIIIGKVSCAACLWVNEHYLQQLPGVIRVSANYATARIQLIFDPKALKLSDILLTIERLGYHPQPLSHDNAEQFLHVERQELLLKLGVAAAFSMQVMMLALVDYFAFAQHLDMQERWYINVLNCLLTAPVVLYSAQGFYRSAWRAFSNATVNMDVAVSLAVLLGYLGSIVNTLNNAPEVYYDSVSMFVFLLLVGRYYEFMARKRAVEERERLLRATPQVARRITQTLEEIIPAMTLQSGDQIRVLPGETIPADGIIISGTSSINESLLTGESLPVSRQPGENVMAGSINIESAIELKITQTGKSCALNKILSAVAQAHYSKPKVILLVDRYALWFLNAVLITTLIVTGYHWYFAHPQWFSIGLTLLVVSCPCALSIATPATITAACDRFLHFGLLVTDSRAIETLSEVTHIVFDKTGTLTDGRLTLQRIDIQTSLSNEEILSIAAALERHSEHPIAKAILQAADSLPMITATEVLNQPGAGLEGRVDQQRYYLGTRYFIKTKTGLTISSANREQPLTEVVLARPDQILAILHFQDQPRAGVTTMIAELKSQGYRVSLMSGDNQATCEKLATELGITDVKANLSPQEKLAAVQALQQYGAVVAMVGDGINDAPVLAQADVSIAMHQAADLAKINADLVMLNGQTETLLQAFKLAQRAMRIIKQNIYWAFAYNGIAIPIAASGFIAPWIAALGMTLSSILVIANSWRIADFKLTEVK